MNIDQKPSYDVTIICFQDKTIFILLDCSMQLLQIQRLTKYDHRFAIVHMVKTHFLFENMWIYQSHQIKP